MTRNTVPIKAVLFDLDNTLYGYDVCNEAALRHAHMILCASAPVTWQDFRSLHDDVRNEIAQRLRHQAASHNRIIFFKEMTERIAGRPQPEQALELYRAYWREFEYHMALAPDARRVLDELRRDFRLAIVSNHTTQVQLDKLDSLGIADCFDTIVTSEEAGAEKPDQAIFEFALARLKVQPAETAMVGDHPDGDIAGARRAGILAIYSREFAGDAPAGMDADYQIDRMRDLPAILRA